MAEEKKKNWTPGQRQAIASRRGDLIISAAAGSGKTAVLCERVIRSLLDENDPISISDMLIVTFTEASAKELKIRIANAIRAQMEKNPSDRRLIRQLLLLQSADIGTIHGFCNRLISRNTSRLSLPSGVHVADAYESDIIALKMMEKTVDEMYLASDGFPALVETFTMSRDSEISKIFLDIYKKMQSSPKGITLLRDFATEFAHMDKDSWENSRYARQICSCVKAEAEFYLRSVNEYVGYIRDDEYVYSKWGESYEYDLEYVTAVVNGATKGWSALNDALEREYEPPKRASVSKKNIADETVYEMQEMREDVQKQLKKLRTDYFSSTPAVLASCERNAKFMYTLYEVLYGFEKSFAQEKVRLSLVDFTDLERMAYKLLVDENGEPTPLAIETGAKYKQIYIDEYQDTNSIQDGIFKAISRANRFMVGDIKQSIYSFRGAEPSIFANYRDTFADYNENNANADDEPHRIFLSNNFRCDRPIIEFTNGIFATLFRNNSGKIAYLDSDRLEFSKDDPPKEKYDNVSIIVAQRDKQCPFYTEALAVASEVKGLLASGVRAGDIAVIMRSTTTVLKVFKAVFEKEGIPVDNASSGTVFDSPEVLFLLSLLNCIDNPHRDVWFAGAISSRIFGIEFNDVVDMASEKCGSKLSLYDRFRAYTEKSGFEKGKRFLEWLSDSRERSRGMKVSEIIDCLCRDFAIYALALAEKENADKAKKYIEEFKKLARNYEKSSFRGLHSFLSLVEDMRSGKAGEIDVKSEDSDSKDTVKFITAHHSKGLEFEYCFVSGCGKEMNDRDTKSKFLFAPAFGAVVRPLGFGGKVKYNSPIFKAVAENMKENSVDEEMRILYVTLTRAKKKLYVTGESADPEKLLSLAEKMRDNVSPYVFRKNDSYIEWVLASYDKSAKDVDLFLAIAAPYEEWRNGVSHVVISRIDDKMPNDTALADDASDVAENPETTEENTSCETVLEVDEIRKRLEYSYPYASEQTLPSKLAVSRLFPGVLDADAVDLVRHEEKFTDIPRFISSSGNAEITGAMRGTATHVFMQFCDFENAEKNGVEIELARLCDKSFIDPAMAELVYIDKLKAFFASSLYKEIKSARSIWREKRFSIMLPASEFTHREELKDRLSDAQLLVQGVFDCLIERADGTLKLIDYKTDAVSGNDARDEEMFRTRYTTQLSYYKRACELMMGREVGCVSVYSFGLGREIIII